MIGTTGDVSANGHYRYLSGLLLGIGTLFFLSIPRIERYSVRFRVLGTVVFVGGLARFGGLLSAGVPDPPMLFGLVMELAVTPTICFWQARIAVRIQNNGTN
jgi:hypothetical protein